jgi:hypothetical protein
MPRRESNNPIARRVSKLGIGRDQQRPDALLH